ncbi:hypothetical protein B0T10DRAFT_42409 [Thelonectria olida]|uniref:Clr5 domain-containing protein n=1 Tax=Thelonectria olida TaxID=1576542 RepID=A0A9P8W5P8_9HYPO|nr:hypothetical protein B0T10DRAFT_42409 [Thelonectria olida]
MFNPSAGRPRASDSNEAAPYGFTDQAWSKFGLNTSTASSIQPSQPSHASGRNFDDSSDMDWTPSLSDYQQQQSFIQPIDSDVDIQNNMGSIQAQSHSGRNAGVGRLVAHFENKGFAPAPPLPPRPSNTATNPTNTNPQTSSPFGNFGFASPNLASPLSSPSEVNYASFGGQSRVASPIASPPPMPFSGFQAMTQAPGQVSSGPFGSMNSFMANDRMNSSIDMGMQSPMITSPMTSTPMVTTHMPTSSMHASTMATPKVTTPSTTGVPGTPGFAIWRPPVPGTPKPVMAQSQGSSNSTGNTGGHFAKPPVPSTPKPVMNAGSQFVLDFNNSSSGIRKAPARVPSKQPARQPARRPSRQQLPVPTPVFSPSPTPKQELKQEPQTPQLSQISPAPLPAERRPSVSLRPQTGTRPSREQVPAEAWESFKSTIRTLYLEERKPLKEVMNIMTEKYGFQATPKMYKTRFSQWGFVKNNTEEEVKRLLSMKFQRDAEGKVSEFVRNGKVVNLGTYLKRKGVTEYDLIDFEQPADLPAHVKCRTPTPPPATGCLSPEMQRAQEIVIANIRKAFLQCRQSEVETETQVGWPTIMVWGAGSSELLLEANRFFEQSDHDQGGHYLMLAFKELEMDLKKLSPQGIKELLLGMVNRDPGMMTALCKYLAAFSSTNFERSHPLRQIFACLYEVQQKHGSSTLSELLWHSISMIAEELEAIYGRRHPYVARTWIDLAMFYNIANAERLEKLVTELRLLQRQMEHRLGMNSVDVLVLRYAICQLMFSANPNSDNTKQTAMDLWNHMRSMGYVYAVRDSRPNVYCYHSPVKVDPWTKRCRRRYETGLRFMEEHVGVKILPYFEEDFHTTEHAEDHIPQQVHHHHVPQQMSHHQSQYSSQQQMSQQAPNPQDAWAAAMGMSSGPRWGGFI